MIEERAKELGTTSKRLIELADKQRAHKNILRTKAFASVRSETPREQLLRLRPGKDYSVQETLADFINGTVEGKFIEL